MIGIGRKLFKNQNADLREEDKLELKMCDMENGYATCSAFHLNNFLLASETQFAT